MTKAEIITLLVQHLGPIVGTVVAGLASWALMEAARWVRTRTRNEKAARAIERLGHTVTTTVADIEQTVGRKYSELASDGQISRMDKHHLKELARTRVMTLLTPEIQRGAQIAIKDLAAFIDAKIEQAVLELKRSTPEVLTAERYSPVLPDSGPVDFGGAGAQP